MRVVAALGADALQRLYGSVSGRKAAWGGGRVWCGSLQQTKGAVGRVACSRSGP